MGKREGQYRKTSLDFFAIFHLHPHLYLKDHNKNLPIKKASDFSIHTSNVCVMSTVTGNKILRNSEPPVSHALFSSIQFSSVPRSCLTL